MDRYVYKPEDVGRVIVSTRGNNVTIRKYHLTDKEIATLRTRWEEYTAKDPKKLKDAVGPLFFNPYRRGIYFAELTALYLLGANEYHSFVDVKTKTRELMEQMTTSKKSAKDAGVSAWQDFIGKTPKGSPKRSKDETGRIQENMIFMQRLAGQHPSGYKLRQACASVDIKKVTKDGLPNGAIFYRLSTFGSFDDSLPTRDIESYEPAPTEKKYFSRKFMGKIVTKEGTFVGGVLQA